MRTYVLALAVAVAVVGCAAHRARGRAASDGAIAGLVRDQTSGEAIGMAELRLVAAHGHETRVVSNIDGTYMIDPIAPGRYTLRARFAEQPITITNIDVRAGEATFVDVTFTLGNPVPLTVDYGDPRQGEIVTFPSGDTLIEGIVAEAGSRSRMVGVVVTALGPTDTLQTITDAHGRYRFDALAPGTYAISTYYSIGGRGQIEVRRSEIVVSAGQRVIVPMWVETAKH